MPAVQTAAVRKERFEPTTAAPAMVPADLKRRAVAFLLDSALFLVLVYPAEMISLFLVPHLFQDFQVGSQKFRAALGGFRNLAVFCAVAVLFRFLYSGAFLAAKGATPGKMLVGIRVCKADGTPIGFFRGALRETIGQFLAWVLFPLGHLPAKIRSDRRAAHDLLTGTWVVMQPPKSNPSALPNPTVKS